MLLLTINIGIDPEVVKIGELLLTWHGIFTAVAIAVGVMVALPLARRLGFSEDDVYSAALIGIPCAIIGARAVYVFENWGTFQDDPLQIVRVNEGGIAIYGAVIGGLIGGLGYGIVRRLPLRRGLDGAAIALLVGMAIGRIGDIINGEHFAKPSSLPWAVRYTNENSPSLLAHPQCGLFVETSDPSQVCAQHPAVAYEMLGDLLIAGVLLVILRYVRRDGVTFFSFLLLYAVMRFGLSYLRLDSPEVFAGLTTPQVISLGLIPIAILGLLYSWFSPRAQTPAPVAAPTSTRPEPDTRT